MKYYYYNPNKLIFFVFLLISKSIYSQNPEVVLQTGHTSQINSICFIDNDKYLASGGEDNLLIIWELKTGKQIYSLNKHQEPINQIIFNEKHSKMVSCSDDSTVIVWDFPNIDNYRVYKFNYVVHSIAFDTSKTSIYCAAKEIVKIDFLNEKVQILENESSRNYNSISLSSDGKYIALADADNHKIYVKSSTDLKDKTIFLKTSNKVQFSPDATKLFSANYYGTLSKWNTPNFPLLKNYCIQESKKKHSVTDVIVGNSIFAFSSKDNCVYLYNTKNGYRKNIITSFESYPTCLALNSNEKYFVSADCSNKIKIWDIETCNLLQTLEGESNRINTIKFTPNGKSIVIGYHNGKIKKWDLSNCNNFINNQLQAPQLSNNNLWKYAVTAIDSISESHIYFQAIKYKSYKLYSTIIKKSFHCNAVWDINANEISIKEGKPKKYKLKDHQKLTFTSQADLGYTIKGNEIFVAKQNNHVKTGHTDKISTVINTPGYETYVTSSWDGTIKLWEKNTNRLLATMGAMYENDYFIFNPNNYYYTSKNAIEKIAFRIGNHGYGYEQFDLKYNRPDTVFAALPFVDDQLKKAYVKAFNKRKSKLSTQNLEFKTNAPEITINNTVQSVLNTEFTFSLEANGKNTSLKALHVWLNGVPIYGINGKTITGQSLKTEINLTLSSGYNHIKTSVENSDGLYSLTESIEIYCKANDSKPNLFFVAIGASEYSQKDYNLNYAAKDANDLAIVFAKDKAFAKKNIKVIENSKIDKNTLDTVRWFFSKAKVNDVVILFYAGHGVFDNNLNYYLSTYDIDFNNPSAKGISYDNLIGIFDTLNAQKRLLLIDACHSGEIDKEEITINTSNKSTDKDGEIKFRNVGTGVKYKSAISLENSFELAKTIFADLRLNNGTTVISSAGGAEFALEGEKWRNGVFTYSFIKGLQNKKADINKDNIINIDEIIEYLSNEVFEITNGMQKSTSRTENTNNIFRIW